MQLKQLLCVAALLAATMGATRHSSVAYRVEMIAPNAEATGKALAINARGDVAGQIDDGAFIWRDGHFTQFPGEQFMYLGTGYTSIATGLNRDGVAVGSDGSYTPCSMTGMEIVTAVFFRAGKMQYLDTTHNCGFEIDGINDVGTMVGLRSYRGFVRYSDGSSIEIQPLSNRPENNGTRASAINNEGYVVGGTTIDVANVPQVPMGEQTDRNGVHSTVYGPDLNTYVVHAFLATFAGGVQHMHDLGALPDFPDTYATAISEDLTVVGYSGTHSWPKGSRVSGLGHAWVWQNGHMTDLGAPKGESSFAYGVNDGGTIVGCSSGNAVRWVNKHLQNLNDLIDPHSGWFLECAHAINRSGMIVGTGSYDGHEMPFRLVPISS